MEYIKYVIDYGIIGLLVFMSLAGFAISIERYLFFRTMKLYDYPERKRLELALTERLHLIASIGSNAPYIGLLGTVLGIMFTFYSMGQNGFMDTGKIMIGLAMALKVTAVGLLVAIPAVFIYNLLLRKAKVILMQWDIEDGREGI
ncbi:MAG: TonB-system energizer ExbB [Desulfobacterales bacterium]|jgi:biopolymer transport protein ExbB|nr:TonB-system energizer ExbB [Desulfobulbaceae bacterium]MDX2435217.1 TonB-system energizer ExbB [Desulfobacterales bacterium]NOQ67200.1 TonB-system energizer ExbB [Desulfobacterales bacterium]